MCRSKTRDFKWKLRNAIFKITHSSFWLANYNTCWEWDEELNDLLDNHEIEWDGASVCVAVLGQKKIWVANYPYAYGYNYKDPNKLPAPLTRFRLRERMKDLEERHLIT